MKLSVIARIIWKDWFPQYDFWIPGSKISSVQWKKDQK